MKKILIIEDEPEARSLLARRLSAHRYEVLEAGDGAEGMLKAKEAKPDLIVLDLKLPGQDGIEIYGSMRKNPALVKVPVLFLTAISTGESMSKQSLGLIASAKHGVELTGNYRAMGKPYDAKRLVEALREMLEGR